MALAAMALVGAGALVACEDESAGPEQGVTFEEVVEDDGDRLVGRTVTVSARVDEVVAPATFFLGADTDERVLVVTAERVQPDENVIVGGSYVEVTGEVRDFSTAEPRGRRAAAELDDVERRAAQEENYIVADSVRLFAEPG